jgi:hypothetical protein
MKQKKQNEVKHAEALLALALDTRPAPGTKPDLAEIAAWHAGRLPEPRAGEVKAHVARDAECYRLWYELRTEEVHLWRESHTAKPAQKPGLWGHVSRWWTSGGHGRRIGGALAAATVGLFAAVIGLKILLAPDLAQQIEDSYARWDAAYLPPAESWPLSRRGGGEKSMDLWDPFGPASRTFEIQAFRSGMRVGIQRLSGDSPLWQGAIERLSDGPLACPEGLAEATCAHQRAILEDLGRWVALEQFRCASGQVVAEEEGDRRQSLVEDLTEALRDAGIAGKLATVFEAWSGEELRDPVHYCRRIERLVLLGK